MFSKHRHEFLGVTAIVNEIERRTGQDAFPIG